MELLWIVNFSKHTFWIENNIWSENWVWDALSIHCIQLLILSKECNLNSKIWVCRGYSLLMCRWNVTEMWEKLRGKRLMFVGDSLNRGQWISMVCVLVSIIPADKRSMSPNAHLTIFRAEVRQKNPSYRQKNLSLNQVSKWQVILGFVSGSWIL